MLRKKGNEEFSRRSPPTISRQRMYIRAVLVARMKHLSFISSVELSKISNMSNNDDKPLKNTFVSCSRRHKSSVSIRRSMASP